MGNNQSAPSYGEGYQIGGVVENSPAHHAGLVPFFDFVRKVDGNPIAHGSHTGFFKDYMKNHENQKVSLEMFNSKTRTNRVVTLTPTTSWSNSNQGLLGCSVNWENIDEAITRVYRVLEVHEGGNAQKSGLQSMRDFIVGMQTVPPLPMNPNRDQRPPRPRRYISAFQDGEDFKRRLQSREQCFHMRDHPYYQDRTMLVLVYDLNANELREVLTEFPLGCDIGTGYLHTVPCVPGETQIPVIKTFFREAPSQQQSQPYSTAQNTNAAPAQIPPQHHAQPQQQNWTSPPPQGPAGHFAQGPPPTQAGYSYQPPPAAHVQAPPAAHPTTQHYQQPHDAQHQHYQHQHQHQPQQQGVPQQSSQPYNPNTQPQYTAPAPQPTQSGGVPTQPVTQPYMGAPPVTYAHPTQHQPHGGASTTQPIAHPQPAPHPTYSGGYTTPHTSSGVPATHAATPSGAQQVPPPFGAQMPTPHAMPTPQVPAPGGLPVPGAPGQPPVPRPFPTPGAPMGMPSIPRPQATNAPRAG